MRVFREEVFGPVTPLFTFSTDAEALALANDTEYGLAAYAYTQVGRGRKGAQMVALGGVMSMCWLDSASSSQAVMQRWGRRLVAQVLGSWHIWE